MQTLMLNPLMYTILGTMKQNNEAKPLNGKCYDRKSEKFVAVCSFFAAVLLAFTSLIVSKDHDITGGVLMMCAQFLTLTATIFGIDYKFTNHRKQYDKE